MMKKRDEAVAVARRFSAREAAARLALDLDDRGRAQCFSLECKDKTRRNLAFPTVGGFVCHRCKMKGGDGIALARAGRGLDFRGAVDLLAGCGEGGSVVPFRRGERWAKPAPVAIEGSSANLPPERSQRAMVEREAPGYPFAPPRVFQWRDESSRLIF